MENTNDIKQLSQSDIEALQPAPVIYNTNNNCTILQGGTFTGCVFPVPGAVTNVYGAPDERRARRGADCLDLPADLATEHAMVYWTRLRDAGFVDAGWRRTEKTTLAAAACIAENFALQLSLPKKYTYFEELWGIKNLRRYYQEKPKFAAEIDHIFRK